MRLNLITYFSSCCLRINSFFCNFLNSNIFWYFRILWRNINSFFIFFRNRQIRFVWRWYFSFFYLIFYIYRFFFNLVIAWRNYWARNNTRSCNSRNNNWNDFCS
ncbi:hypothetical protein MSU_0043 [Mycoplasma suis str. Illinois]|uniref:Uncharacterized protein n=1 Tax=Mycoplasma suis (strain Illinois) TaxID=768700 RepID=F0QQ17_MYCSL|nr:hypothetical protein MSU_0043 [Mycoplasma suis str. Illinois]